MYNLFSLVIDNKPWSWRIAEGFVVQIISNSTLSVDTFFFLSGFLVAYMYLVAHRDDRPGKPNYGLKVLEYIVTVIRRFIRYAILCITIFRKLRQQTSKEINETFQFDPCIHDDGGDSAAQRFLV